MLPNLLRMKLRDVATVILDLSVAGRLSWGFMNSGSAHNGMLRLPAGRCGLPSQVMGAARWTDSMEVAFPPVGVTVHFNDSPLRVIRFLQAVVSKKVDPGFRVL